MAASSLLFEDFLHLFVALYQKGAYAQALLMLQDEGTRFPENASQIIIWQSAMLSRLGQQEEALRTLELAYDQGYWCHEMALLHDPDFEGLQTYPGFAELVERMTAMRKEAIQQAQPGLAVVEPDKPGPYPLFLALHGNYSNINMTAPLWRPVVEQGWLLAVPQSSQPGWTNGISVWDDVVKSSAEINTHMEGLLARYPVNTGAVIAGGFSMGAHMAVRMAIDPAYSLRGVVAVEAWFNDAGMGELEQIVRDAPPVKTRVVLIAGKENEEYHTMAQKVQELLEGHGMACKFVESSNPQHAYPPELRHLLLEAIDWIMC